MISDAPALIDLIVGLLVASGLLGGGFAVFRMTDLRGTIRDQEHALEAKDALIEVRTVELAEARLKLEELSMRLDLAEQKIQHLDEVVSGRIDFGALEVRIDQHHADIERLITLRMDRLESQYGEVLGMLRDLLALAGGHRDGETR
jgi:hypothetical protein